jgi:hypothetical protein
MPSSVIVEAPVEDPVFFRGVLPGEKGEARRSNLIESTARPANTRLHPQGSLRDRSARNDIGSGRAYNSRWENVPPAPQAGSATRYALPKEALCSSATLIP